MKRFIGLFLFLLGLLVMLPTGVRAEGQNGTTLSANKSATGHFTRTFGWTLNKSVSPTSWDLFKGDTGTSTYTVTVTKDSGTDAAFVDGQVCVTNGGAVATENLAIADQIVYKTGGGPFQNLPGGSAPVDVSGKPVLGPGESHCYPYSIAFSPAAGAIYKNTVNVTITNHSGHLGLPFGPGPDADFSIPSSPSLVNDTVHVTDTNGGAWEFAGSGSQTYTEKFGCPSLGQRTVDNTATITETGQSATASVIVSCYDPTVTKTADTSLDRTYHWSISKTADQSAPILEKNIPLTVNYTVTPSVDGGTDSDWRVGGSVTIHNPAPIPATINSVSDLVSGDIAGTVTCPGITFPAVVGPTGTLSCTYAPIPLPDATARTNTATAVQQNFDYTFDETGEHAQAAGTTSYTGTAPVDFSAASVNPIDECVNLADTVQGNLGQQCVNTPPHPVTYTSNISMSACGAQIFPNTASFTTNDTAANGSSTWNVNANVPCPTGCTLTIGYWKNHGGITTGKQQDIITLRHLLPQRLGACSIEALGVCLVPGNKSLKVPDNQTAYDVLTMKTYGSASNGITKLYAQLLGAKFNIASGANPPTGGLIGIADDFLGGKNWLDWSSLTKTRQNQVNGWMSALDSYNNGLSGVPHCSE